MADLNKAYDLTGDYLCDLEGFIDDIKSELSKVSNTSEDKYERKKYNNLYELYSELSNTYDSLKLARYWINEILCMDDYVEG